MDHQPIYLKALALKHPKVLSNTIPGYQLQQKRIPNPVHVVQSMYVPRKEGAPMESSPSPGLVPLAAPRLLLAGWLLPSAGWG